MPNCRSLAILPSSLFYEMVREENQNVSHKLAYSSDFVFTVGTPILLLAIMLSFGVSALLVSRR
jgi:predicted RND superfamily exporter protein